MGVDINKILGMVEKVLDLEKKISTEIRKEKDASKRKKLLAAVKNHDSAALRNLWFK